MRPLLVVLMVTCVALAGAPVTADEDDAGKAGTRQADLASRVARHGGANRFATAVAIADAAYPDPSQVTHVVIADGGNFPDAIGAAALAGSADAPILLVNTTSVPEETRARLAGYPNLEQIYVLGGTAAVDQATLLALDVFAPARRLNGRTRNETAWSVASQTAANNGSTVGQLDGERYAIVVNEGSFREPLLIGPFAHRFRIPILLTNGDQLTSVTAEALEQLRVDRVMIVGNTTLVSDAVEQELSGLVNGVERISGADHNELALAIAGLLDGSGFSNDALIASATNFSDALSGAALAGVTGQTIFLTEGEPDPRVVDWIAGRSGAVTGLGLRAAVAEYALEVLSPGVDPQLTLIAEGPDGVTFSFSNPRDPNVAGLHYAEDGDVITMTVFDTTGAVTATAVHTANDGAALFITPDGDRLRIVPTGNGTYVIEVATDEGVVVREVERDDLRTGRSSVPGQGAARTADFGQDSPPPVFRGAKIPIARAQFRFSFSYPCTGAVCEAEGQRAVAQTDVAVTCPGTPTRAECDGTYRPNPDNPNQGIVTVTHYAKVPRGTFSTIPGCGDRTYTTVASYSNTVATLATFAGVGLAFVLPKAAALGKAVGLAGAATTIGTYALTPGEFNGSRCIGEADERAALEAAGLGSDLDVAATITLIPPRFLGFTPPTRTTDSYQPYATSFGSDNVRATYDVDITQSDTPPPCDVSTFVPWRTSTYIRFPSQQRQADTCSQSGTTPDPDPDPAPGGDPGWYLENARPVNGDPGVLDHSALNVGVGGGSATRVVHTSAGDEPGEWRYTWSWEAPPQFVPAGGGVSLDARLTHGSIDYEGGYSGQLTVTGTMYSDEVVVGRGVAGSWTDTSPRINMSCGSGECAVADGFPTDGTIEAGFGTGSDGDVKIWQWNVHNCGQECGVDWEYVYRE